MVELLIALLYFWSFLTLVSFGFSLLYVVGRIINLAHGAFYVLGGYVMSLAVSNWGLQGALTALAIIVLLSLVLGPAFRRFVEFFGRDNALVSTFALLLLAVGVYEHVFVGNYSAYELRRSMGTIDVAGSPVEVYLLVVIAAISLFLALVALAVYRTGWGSVVRAVFDDPEMADALGVKVGRVVDSLYTLAILATMLGGALSAGLQAIAPFHAIEILIYAFAVSVVAGLGNVFGVALSALLVAGVRSVVAFYIPLLDIVVIYAVVAATLLFRPEGLLRRYERRV